MYFIKKSQRKKAKVSFVLLDWSVRESFHVLHYLKQQDCDRDDFEVIIIEYYDREYEGIRKYEEQVDTWLVMQMPQNSYYHKHLMYNLGVIVSSGEIISICDSDAMVKSSYVSKISNTFKSDPNIVFHMDQFRNNKKEYYPFNYPTLEEVLGEGCINYSDNLTSGIVDNIDPIHTRNYGACMCARKEDLIAIGGADEHIDYVGHICGPYDMTFRLVNYGKKEIWSHDEFLYHTWHPGSDGVDNYMGPHDGKNMSTTSLLSLINKRIFPLVENNAIRKLREGEASGNIDDLLDCAIDKERMHNWSRELLDSNSGNIYKLDSKHLIETYCGCRIYQDGEIFSIETIKNDQANIMLYEEQFNSIEKAKIFVESLLTNNTRTKILFYKILSKILYVIKHVIFVLKEPRKIFKLFNFFKVREKINRDLKTRNIFSANIVDLIIYLNQQNKGIDSNFKIILLDKIDEIVIRLFVKLNLIPAILVTRIFNKTDLIKVINKKNDAKNKLLIPSSTYIRFYTVFIDRDELELIIV